MRILLYSWILVSSDADPIAGSLYHLMRILLLDPCVIWCGSYSWIQPGIFFCKRIWFWALHMIILKLIHFSWWIYWRLQNCSNIFSVLFLDPTLDSLVFDNKWGEFSWNLTQIFNTFEHNNFYNIWDSLGKYVNVIKLHSYLQTLQ